MSPGIELQCTRMTNISVKSSNTITTSSLAINNIFPISRSALSKNRIVPKRSESGECRSFYRMQLFSRGTMDTNDQYIMEGSDERAMFGSALFSVTLTSTGWILGTRGREQ